MATARTNMEAKAPKSGVGNRGASLTKSTTATAKKTIAQKTKREEDDASATKKAATSTSRKSDDSTDKGEAKITKSTTNKSTAKTAEKKDSSSNTKRSTNKSGKKKSDSNTVTTVTKENKKSNLKNADNKKENVLDKSSKVSSKSSKKAEKKGDEKVSKARAKNSGSKEPKKSKQSKSTKKSQVDDDNVNVKKSSKTKKSDKSISKNNSDDSTAKSLADLYKDGLKDIYWAEKALKKALPKMHKNASLQKLKDALSSHLDQTEDHILRLSKCFEELGQRATAEKCDAMAGLLEEADGLMKDAEEGAVRDVAIIAAAQKVEHYEIATYGTLAAYAKVLGYSEGLKHLIYILDEEKACDDLLSKIADTALNTKAK